MTTKATSALFASFDAFTPLLAAGRRVAPTGQIYAKTAGASALGCFFYSPKKLDLSRRPLVCVHGISRNAIEHVYAFRQRADEEGFAIIAPLFDQREYRGYQTLGSKNGWNALVAFDGLLDEIAAESGAKSVDIFGFSGGGQFAHRLAMARPARVGALAIASAGWYTFPGDDARYPRGQAGKRPPGADEAAFLAIPMLVTVGSDDLVRDATLRQGRRLNAQQGVDRVDRARNWTAAVNDAARARGLLPPVVHAELQGAAHSFTECVAAGLVRHAGDFFHQASSRKVRAVSGE